MKTANPQPTLCKYCEKPVPAGRIDKKFCNDEHRSQYHNKQNRNPESREAKIKKALRKNEKILKDFFQECTSFWQAIPWQALKCLRYDFKVYTGTIVNTRSGGIIKKIYYFGLESNKDGRTFHVHIINKDGRPIYLGPW